MAVAQILGGLVYVSRFLRLFAFGFCWSFLISWLVLMVVLVALVFLQPFHGYIGGCKCFLFFLMFSVLLVFGHLLIWWFLLCLLVVVF